MSERVKLADAEVLSALTSTDYLLAERNGAIGRAALGESTLLTEAQRLWLEYYPKASGANILKSADFGDGYASDWSVTSPWTLATELLDRVNGFTVDASEQTANRDLTQYIDPSALEGDSWYTLSFWHRGASILTFTPNLADGNVNRYIDGAEVASNSDNSRTWSAVDDWTKHYIVFKALAEITSQVRVLFRSVAGNAEAAICMPKFERGPIATPWGG